ncbi:MAG: CapA family protein [Agathobacter rectalis]
MLRWQTTELAYTTRGQRQVGKAYRFRADPKMPGFLRAPGIDMVSVANNHVFDYGEQGIFRYAGCIACSGNSVQWWWRKSDRGKRCALCGHRWTKDCDCICNEI